ncbi:hypothetical protein OG2516_06509 [Oceanicola granulosus HTCC2516]|uniref:Nucleotide-diphospho-sugar transferase domain-containing protein n=1 Tax=Oceanicola granulosus (strain ATCC BAA-861 / DSM 15982 / KCTC 12143 / HTCC2516) TaxID=314256 RepID=Q2CBN0_OCEGH|nr:hypothetical protein [Oceanicola granulosus]EAR50101.1 hypothetical protein OG2516_06509 [Oceanicola granulosus HTCC2516]
MVAAGAAHVTAANKALESFKRHAPALPACLFTDRPELAEGWDIVRPVTAAHGRSKVDCLPETPFARTLYVDTDTLALADIRPVFALLDRFDVAICHIPMWQRPNQNRTWRHELPYAFPQMNGGVILYRADGRARALLESWRETYHVARAEAGIRSDQITLREAIWQADDLRLYILPPQWNKRIIEVSELLFSDQPKPIILHLNPLRPPRHAGQRLLARFIRWAAPKRWRHRGALGPDPQ